MPAPSSVSADVVVLGGGPAGLAAAWYAARSGRSVVLLERAGQLGGMAASHDVAGVRVDHGSHRLHPATEPDLLADLRGLLGGDLQTRPRNGRLSVYGRWVGFPLRPTELARSLPPAAIAGIARDAMLSPLRMRRAEPTSYADALTRSLGPALYGALYAPFAQKLWGLPGEEVDAEQARRRVSADTPWKIAAKVLRRSGSGQGRVFHYPRRGFGQITEALAAAAVDAGADLRTSTEVVDVGSGAHPRVVDAAGTTYDAGRVLSTVPLPALARLAQPDPPTAVVDAARSLDFRAMALVYVVHDGGRWSPYDAHYLPDLGTPVTRLSEPANYRVSADDPTDRSVICAEIPCGPGDALWTASDEELVDVVVQTAARRGLPPARVVGSQVRRLRHVYPVYRAGYADPLAAIDRWARDLPGVTTFGRLGLFAHDNTHHALAMARDAVSCLRGDGGWDERAWSASRERFATHVVED